MADFFEIDFLDVETKKSGDAISLRYEIANQTFIHVVDGGYVETGEKLALHINQYYGNPKKIDHVVVTHNDHDHTGGLRYILENYEVGRLWILRPWIYAGEIIHRFQRFSNVENLAKELKQNYSNLAALDEIAQAKSIPMSEPFQGAKIGAFTVLAPTKTRFLDLVVESEKTPATKSALDTLLEGIATLAKAAIKLVKEGWGFEKFSTEPISAENRMSVIQYAYLNGRKILLTGDAGVDGLLEAAAYAPFAGLILPGIDRFQVPHHGSRRNLSTEICDAWLGKRLPAKPDSSTFVAMISSAKLDEDHPRKAVIRAMIHRGAKVLTTEGGSITTYANAPAREGWGAVPGEPYPDEIEE
ncbi:MULTISPECIES: MBL fold metallo-hydrolase [unclassified Mesorhizobium]|uniref:ComEC/Rec2 family competence protein n=1 Tax=unclassified Mesorhizobium TaxID=325217 RepID=UPI00112D74F0|nr:MULTISPECIES: MBL fold metallo-hydrolase [unclassified Mesorhizobium]MBZ9974199.1 MBL fold metallo-hydrolase [Mesorhizobium sp. BR-1-1-10]TPK10301.1 MBL fold metallo-hydrolase [Mesorhizobium sp. B2-5-7]